jgi:hypothetical protein
MKMANALNSNISILLIGFLLTGLIGNHIASQYQERQWMREKEIEILSRRLDETQQVVEELTVAMRMRFYAMQKVLWELESNRVERADKEWAKYQKVKDEWNINIYIYRNKLSRLLGENLGYRLIGPKNAVEREETEIHSSFVEAHVALRKMLRHQGTKDERASLYENAHQKLNRASANVDVLTKAIFEAYLGEYGVLHSELTRFNGP